MRDNVEIIVATIAFGMGIDKPDIRLLVHYELPKSPEGYYQETGRAGRDGLPSECVLLYNYGDVSKQEFFVNQIEDETERTNARQKLAKLVEFCQIQSCRRRFILRYFGEEWAEENCGGCDFCLTPREEFDATIIAQKILSAVIRTGQRFGIGYVSEVLRGANTKAVRQRKHDELSVYGIEKEFSDSQIRELAGHLVAKGLLFRNNSEYPTFGVTEAGRSFLSNRDSLTLFKPKRDQEKESSARRATLDYDQTLFDLLRGLRTRLASERGVPPYAIFGDVTLQQMAYYMPQSRESLLNISGVGQKKLEDLGDAFLSTIVTHARSNNLQEKEIPSPRRNKSRRARGVRATHEQTRELLRQGMNIEQIAQHRGFTPSTIARHIDVLLKSGIELDLSPLMPCKERFETITAAFAQSGSGFFSPVKEILGDDYTYDEIRLVWLSLEQQKAEREKEPRGD